MSKLNRGEYFLITNVSSQTTDKYYSAPSSISSTSQEQAIDLNTQSWKLPYFIADEDLTFNGKPLNKLVEEDSLRCLYGSKFQIRGRSRQKKDYGV
ncbi:BgTH12-03153 [Blumeria graminis f. sp. triticale]|uniref:Uncharacterized protein n=4 Tax=Blumeria TaxID=34372 RepID=A0A383UZN7_BLUHO|nr:hypothetical protein BGT96224_A20943 [Blumeria graminis f. sp. tritici 96224]CAD6503490.1 BgTH12-03153 [Blumeria graminis f. sp. triticale]SZF04762.1 unnamed protein product [Blumeria hordei]VDB89588.1 BgtA-20943 [Blumeria graminis f. sp. tritici]